MKMPVIKYILNEPEDYKNKILLPILHADKKQIMFSMPKTIVINPGESKIVDLKKNKNNFSPFNQFRL